MQVSNIKERLIKELIEREGGYSNNPNDPGGETRFGVTKAVALRNGYKESMSSLPLSFAEKVYSSKYWDSMKLDEVLLISEKLVERLFDCAVNLGVSRTSCFIQLSLNSLNNYECHYKDIKVDGLVGQKTIKALDSFFDKRTEQGIEVLIKMITCLQGNHYISTKNETFIYGWFKNRIDFD